MLKDQNDEIKIITDSARAKILGLLAGKTSASKMIDSQGQTIISRGQKFDHEVFSGLPDNAWRDINAEDDHVNERVENIVDNYSEQVELVKMLFAEKISRMKKGDELPPGVIKMVKVFIAIKRKLSVGDKMAGRHGNKGVISRILPEEDMPYLPDGTPVDVVLNPLGVPSRMNVGQILETHLGWAAKGVGEIVTRMRKERQDAATDIRGYLKKALESQTISKFLDDMSDDDIIEMAKTMHDGLRVATPVFDGAREPDIRRMLSSARKNQSGQTVLFDGRTGEPFRSNVTVGIMYVMKLHHLVDDKIHARSIGPYSLVTQQPLGGKAQFGGQRLGEMEVWAMEAYGAAYCLQEFLTVKSDDVAGRTRMYEAIVKGEQVLESGLPEAFNVLVKELQSLSLDVDLVEDSKAELS
jgi:DNA-directed RNA polymerase subunit beta